MKFDGVRPLLNSTRRFWFSTHGIRVAKKTIPNQHCPQVPPVNELTQELFDDLKDLVEWLKEARSVETFAGNASEAMDCDGFYSIAVKASIAEVRNWIDQISNTLKTVGPWCTYQVSERSTL